MDSSGGGEETERGIQTENPNFDEDEAEGDKTTNKEEGFKFVMLRLSLLIVFPILGMFLLSLLFAFLAVLAGQFSITTPLSVPSQCRIVSSSVDLRSSKVCELGVLNYKAKHVFYPFQRNKFRCRYDYYWASVFQVEYKDHSVGQTRMALVEAPDEALPLNCRPNFGTAWLTKDKFKVNESYDCWYTSGISKISLYRDGFFNCQAKDPSPGEMIKRYLFLSTKISQSLFVRKKGKYSFWRWDTIAGVIAGFSTSIISVSFIRILQHIKSWMPQSYVTKMAVWAINTVLLKRACFLVAYFSVICWLTMQYGKRIGFPEIYRVYNY